MLRRVNALGTALIDMGLKDKRISIIGENCSRWAMSYFAVVCGTGIAVPLDKELDKTNITELMNDADVEAVITTGKYEKEFREILAEGSTKLSTVINMTLEYQGKSFDLTPPWRCLDMTDGVKEITGVDFRQIETDEEAQKACLEYGMDPETVGNKTRGKLISEMFETYCEEAPGYLDGPVFVTGHPVDISPLAKKDPSDRRITRRFEAYINGWELGNAFSELNDPIDQYERFVEQQHALFSYIDSNGNSKVSAGHLEDAKISYTGEIIVAVAKNKIGKVFDEKSGIDVWDL